VEGREMDRQQRKGGREKEGERQRETDCARARRVHLSRDRWALRS